MSCINSFGDINETFIIEPLFTGTDVISACTAVYTNFITSCSGNTSIELGTNNISINGNLFVGNAISASTYLNLPIDKFTGGTVTGATLFIGGVSANTISATTYLNLPQDIFVTGGTYSAGTVIFINNSGGTFSISGFNTTTQFTGGTVSGATLFTGGLSANTISATTYLNLPVDPDIYVTGFTFDPITYLLTLNQNTNNPSLSSFTANLAILASDVTITGGSYNPNTGVATFTNNSGATFDVSGFTSGLTDTVITSFEYTPSANTFTINQSNGSAFTATFGAVTGLTVNGTLSATTISGGTLYGDGGNLTNIKNIYTSDGSLSGNRVVDIGSNTLNFSSSTSANNLVLSGGNIGIGTSTPIYKLDVNGGLRVNGSITNETTGVYSNLPNGTAMVIGTISNGGHTAIFTKPNNAGATAIRITDQNINGNQWFFVDSVGSAGFGFSSGTVVNASAQVEIQSITKGFLGPRMTETQRLSISSPATGLVVYQTDEEEGYYIYKSFGWIQII